MSNLENKSLSNRVPIVLQPKVNLVKSLPWLYHPIHQYEPRIDCLLPCRLPRLAIDAVNNYINVLRLTGSASLMIVSMNLPI